MGDGFRFIFTHSVISFVMIAMSTGMFAVRCFGTLLSVYVRDVLQSNAALFGTLNSLIGFGMIAGTQSVRRIAMRISPQHHGALRPGRHGRRRVYHRADRPGLVHRRRHARAGLLRGLYLCHRRRLSCNRRRRRKCSGA